MNRVVVTGAGLLTPIGTGKEEFWQGVLKRVPGARPIQRFDASALPVRIASEIPDFNPVDWMSAREAARTDRFAQMAVAAALLALEDAGLKDDLPVPPERVGVIIGTGIGGLATIEHEHRVLLESGPRRVSPFMVPKLMPNAAAAQVAMNHGFLGVNFAVSSACATGGHAIGEALRALRQGEVDIVLAGGTEAAITPLSVSAFARMGALSRRNDEPERASRPFDKGRDGFVFGEGAGVMVLEREEVAARRQAPVLARLAGYGASCDAYHVTQPDPEGRGASLAMRQALEDASIAPEGVGYINAHGTGTPFNDKIETLAIKQVFGPEAGRIAVSSTKSQTGHLLGAAGAVEAIACVLALERGVLPATINLEEPDPECDLDFVPDGPREAQVSTALSNSFGFGGQNSCLVFTRP